MPSWVTLVVLMLVWCVWTIGFIIYLHLCQAVQRGPKIVLTVFLAPLMALLLWGLALFIDLWLWPWGQAAIITLHALFIMLSIDSLLGIVWTRLKARPHNAERDGSAT